MTATQSPTRETYAELEKAYAFFNAELFENRLPHCMITLQRQHDTYGYFSANQFVSRDGQSAHEIALNPAYFAIRPIPETLSVLVREMVSLDQVLHTRGKLPRRRYRNREWADMAEAIGLMPTDTGLPGGKRVGDSVQTYIIDGGLFDVACSKLVDDAFVLSWMDRFPPKPGVSAAEPLPGGDDDYALADDVEDGSAPTAAEQGLAGTGLAEAGQSLAGESLVSIAEAGLGGDDEMGEGGGFEGLLSSVVSMAAGAIGGNAEGAGASEKAGEAEGKAAPPMKRFKPVEMATLTEIGIEPKESAKNASKTKFTCPVCEGKSNAWGKPSLRIYCGGLEDAEHEMERMVPVSGNAGQPQAAGGKG